MTIHFSSRDYGSVRWQQRSVEYLRRALQFMRALRAVDRQPEALAMIPIRSMRPPATRQRHQLTWRD
jgi:hypothetical protein